MKLFEEIYITFEERFYQDHPTVLGPGQSPHAAWQPNARARYRSTLSRQFQDVCNLVCRHVELSVNSIRVTNNRRAQFADDAIDAIPGSLHLAEGT